MHVESAPGLYGTENTLLCSSIEGPVSHCILTNGRSTVLLFGDIHLDIRTENGHHRGEEETSLRIDELVEEARDIKGLTLTVLTEGHTTNLLHERVTDYMHLYLKAAYRQYGPYRRIKKKKDSQTLPSVCVDARYLHRTELTEVLEPCFYLEGLLSDLFDIVDKYADQYEENIPNAEDTDSGLISFGENSDVYGLRTRYNKPADFKYLLGAFDAIFSAPMEMLRAPAVPGECDSSILFLLLARLKSPLGKELKSRWATRVSAILGPGPPAEAIRCIRGLLAWLVNDRVDGSTGWTDFEAGIQSYEVRRYLFEGNRWELLWGCLLDFHASATILSIPTDGPQLAIGYFGARHISNIRDLVVGLDGYRVVENQSEYKLDGSGRRVVFQNRVDLPPLSEPPKKEFYARPCPRCGKIRQPRRIRREREDVA